MKIYTGTCAGKKLDKVKELDLGIMISPSPTFGVRSEFKQVRCALDNGAFQCYRRGYPFQEKLFLSTIDECYRLGINLDFIVCPDIIAGGKKSLDFSLEWATKRLRGTPKLALVVQDGMVQDDLSTYERDLFTHIFIGGTPSWKWQTLPGWASLCHTYKKKCHVGGCGTLSHLRTCELLRVHSVDSTNFSRNDSWDVIAEYQNRKSLFPVRGDM